MQTGNAAMISQGATDNITGEEARGILVLCLFNLAQIWSDRGERDKALLNFREALKTCSPSERPSILSSMAELVEDKGDRVAVIDEAIDAVVKQHLPLSGRAVIEPLMLNYNCIVALYMQAIESMTSERTQTFYAYIREVYLTSVELETRFCFDVAFRAMAAGRQDHARELLVRLLEQHRSVLSAEIRVAVLKLILFRDRTERFAALRAEYFDDVTSRKKDDFDAFDIATNI